LIFSYVSLILTDRVTIYVAKTVFAGKNYFCHPGFSMEKTFLPPTLENLPTLSNDEASDDLPLLVSVL